MGGRRGGEVVFQMGRASFLSGGVPHVGASILMGGFSKKIIMEGHAHPCPPTMGSPVNYL